MGILPLLERKGNKTHTDTKSLSSISLRSLNTQLSRNAQYILLIDGARGLYGENIARGVDSTDRAASARPVRSRPRAIFSTYRPSKLGQ